MSLPTEPQGIHPQLSRLQESGQSPPGAPKEGSLQVSRGSAMFPSHQLLVKYKNVLAFEMLISWQLQGLCACFSALIKHFCLSARGIARIATGVENDTCLWLEGRQAKTGCQPPERWESTETSNCTVVCASRYSLNLPEGEILPVHSCRRGVSLFLPFVLLLCLFICFSLSVSITSYLQRELRRRRCPLNTRVWRPHLKGWCNAVLLLPLIQ